MQSLYTSEGTSTTMPTCPSRSTGAYATAWRSFRKYTLELYDLPSAPLEFKNRMLRAEVLETTLYGCVTWSPRACHYDTLRRAHHRFLTRCIGWRKQSRRPPDSLFGHAYQDGKWEHRGDFTQEADLVRGSCGAHGAYEIAEVRDVRRIGEGRGLCGGPGKRGDGVFPGRPESSRHQRRPVVVVDSHIQRIALTTEETTVTQQVSHRRIKCQSRLWSQRGTKVNGSHHDDNPLLRLTGIQIATKNYAALQAMAPTNIKTVHQTSLLHISRATSIDSECCRLPTTSVLSKKSEKLRSNQF